MDLDGVHVPFSPGMAHHVRKVTEDLDFATYRVPHGIPLPHHLGTLRMLTGVTIQTIPSKCSLTDEKTEA